MGSHAADQTQKEGQIAETVADDARPCAPLCVVQQRKAPRLRSPCAWCPRDSVA